MGIGDLFRGKKPLSVPSPTPAVNPLEQLQTAYWTYNASEHKELVARGDNLPWKDLLRLHHLNCLELMQTTEGRTALASDDLDDRDVPEKAGEPVRRTLARLASAESPYRPHACVIWQMRGSPEAQRSPDHMGVVTNASLTHMGAIEVLLLDGAGKPVSIGFIGISEVRSVTMGPPALFRPARISFDDGRPPMVVGLPLLYGLSWASPHPHDRDGSLTRFCCNQAMGEPLGNVGIGIGHQDFALRNDKGGAALMGLGSIQEIQTPLDMRDASFDQRCRARGIDPEQARRQHGM